MLALKSYIRYFYYACFRGATLSMAGLVVRGPPPFHGVVASQPGSEKYQCGFFNIMPMYFLKLPWTSLTSVKENIVRKPELLVNYQVGNPLWASVVINDRAFSVWEDAFALQWVDNKSWFYFHLRGIQLHLIFYPSHNLAICSFNLVYIYA